MPYTLCRITHCSRYLTWLVQINSAMNFCRYLKSNCIVAGTFFHASRRDGGFWRDRLLEKDFCVTHWTCLEALLFSACWCWWAPLKSCIWLGLERVGKRGRKNGSSPEGGKWEDCVCSESEIALSGCWFVSRGLNQPAESYCSRHAVPLRSHLRTSSPDSP